MPISRNTTVVTSTKTTIVTTVTPPNQSNRNKWVIGTAIAILSFTACLIWVFYEVFTSIEKVNKIVTVSWNNPNSIKVSPGPSWFLYDGKNKLLNSSKLMTDEDKISLLNLVKDSEDSTGSYKNAVSELAFRSNKEIETSYLLFLVLTAICGAIGVQLRTITNFIGVTCFKNEFNYDVWWPWYFVRPFTGFLIGPLVFTLFDGKIMSLTGKFDHSNASIMAVSVLAGFGSEDVVNTLRTLSKRVFGYKEEK